MSCESTPYLKPAYDVCKGFYSAGTGAVEEGYIGVTGLVVKPYKGFKQSGAIGFVAGVGKGL